MEAGLVDVRTRDNKRHGKIRVDEVARMLEKEKPAPSTTLTNFYKKAWKPETYGFTDASSQDVANPQQVKVAVEVDFSAKLAEIEQVLASGQQWLSGANPGVADAEALQVLKENRPDSISHPNSFAWYAIASKFSAVKQAAWK